MEKEFKKSNKISNQEMNDLIQKIDDGLVQFIKQGKYKQVLLSIGNLCHYSLNNQVYILMQKEDATCVYGIRKWNSFNRYVISNQKAIRIFKPIIKKEKDENDIERSILKGFRAGYVFDISQTQGEEFDVFKFDETKVVENKDKILKSLKNIINKNGYQLKYVTINEIDKDCYGLCNHKNKEIKLRDDLSDLQMISTCIHECGHLLAHSSPREDFKGLTNIETRQIKEIEAESIACVVCNYLGLDTSNFNFSYISGWSSGDISKFRKNLDIISKHAKTIIDGIKQELEIE